MSDIKESCAPETRVNMTQLEIAQVEVTHNVKTTHMWKPCGGISKDPAWRGGYFHYHTSPKQRCAVLLTIGVVLRLYVNYR